MITIGWAIGTQEMFPEQILLPYDYCGTHYCDECKEIYLSHHDHKEIRDPKHGDVGEKFYKCRNSLYPASNVLKKYHWKHGWIDAGEANRYIFELHSYAEGEVGVYYVASTGTARHDFDRDEGEGNEGWFQKCEGQREKYLRRRLSHSCVMWVKAK